MGEDLMNEEANDGQHLLQYLNSVNIKLISLLNSSDHYFNQDEPRDTEAHEPWAIGNEYQAITIEQQSINPMEKYDHGKIQAANSLQFVEFKDQQLSSSLCKNNKSIERGSPNFSTYSQTHMAPALGQTLQVELTQPASSGQCTQYDFQQQIQNEAIYYYQQQQQQQQYHVPSGSNYNLDRVDELFDCAYCAWLSRVSGDAQTNTTTTFEPPR